MRIGINAQLLALNRSYRHAGASRYIYHLIENLQAVDQRNHYTVFTGSQRAREAFPQTFNFDFALTALPTIRPPVRIAWEQFLQPVELGRRRIDMLHSTLNVLPLACPCARVVTIHDVAFLLHPQRFKASKRTYLRNLTRLSVRQANAVIVDAASTKADLVNILGAREEKIVVVPLAPDDDFRPLTSKEALRPFREKYGLPERIILYVGTIEPRKNLLYLIQAYAAIKDRVEAKLVIAGGKGWFYAEVFKLVQDLKLEQDVIFPGYVPDEELPLWYNAATVFVYPSLYEGFGLPPLEAMACGVPVITSNTSSLPEVVGSAGITIDPTDVEQLSVAMAQVLENEELRSSLRQRGLEQAATFSWEKTARRTLEVYRRVCS